MKKYKIFISGVQKELKRERRAIKAYILNDVLFSEYFNVFLFEDIPAKGKSSENLYLGEVDKCGIYIGVFGNEYGSVKKNELSPTEKEFRLAEEKKKEILIFIKGSDDRKRSKRVQTLIKEIRHPRSGHRYRRFNGIDELENSIYESLVEFLREEGIVGKSPFDKAICEDVNFSEIDEKIVESVLNKNKFPIPTNSKLKDILIHLNLLNKGCLTNSAVLLFGKNPHRLHLQSEIKCIQFPGNEIEKPFLDYQIYIGNLFEQIDKAVAFVTSRLKMPVIQQKGTVKVKRPLEIPEFAIYEAIVNAVAHRDYNNNGAVQVMVFADRVEVWNPGKLPTQLSIDSLRKPHTSFPTNPLIAHVLYLSDYIQKAGSGTLEMIKQYRRKGLSEPEFISERFEFRTILPRDNYGKKLRKTTQKATRKTTLKTTLEITKVKLSAKNIEILKIIKKEPYVTKEELAKKVKNITVDGVKYYVKKMKDRKIISRVGKARGGYWKVLVKI